MQASAKILDFNKLDNNGVKLKTKELESLKGFLIYSINELNKKYAILDSSNDVLSCDPELQDYSTNLIKSTRAYQKVQNQIKRWVSNTHPEYKFISFRVLDSILKDTGIGKMLLELKKAFDASDVSCIPFDSDFPCELNYQKDVNEFSFIVIGKKIL